MVNKIREGVATVPQSHGADPRVDLAAKAKFLLLLFRVIRVHGRLSWWSGIL